MNPNRLILLAIERYHPTTAELVRLMRGMNVGEKTVRKALATLRDERHIVGGGFKFNRNRQAGVAWRRTTTRRL